ncbi:hypothetical protein ACO9S2_12450 [Nitrospira sp. NS4]|uniref:hypothetical protein n=1 Tax=Nitrospira sp. NS4 TaxID=3414498 RepID=UPI003C2F5FD5
MTVTKARWPFSLIVCCIGIGCLMGLSSCATDADRSSWIQIGVTTKDEVIERYGQPDMVRLSSEGETATYRPVASLPASPPPPVAQVVEAGPEGKMTFTSRPVIRGLGARHVAAGTQDRPGREIRIRYDARGIVQEVLD